MPKGNTATATRPTISVEIGGNQLSASPAEREFKSGKRGFGVYEKIQDPTTGKRYQLSINMVEIAEK